MKTKLLIGALCLIATSANASIPYRVRQVRTPQSELPNGNDNESFARRHRFYVGGMYDYSMWQSYTDENNLYLEGKNTSSFDVVAGVRIYDIFRVEANYTLANAKWGDLSLTGNTVMMNALFDARIDSMYRLFRTQRIVPYVGFGAGLSANEAKHTKIDNKVSPVVAVMAGLGLEMGEYFTLDMGYRYMYMFSPEFDVVSGLNPMAHQLRVGARINF